MTTAREDTTQEATVDAVTAVDHPAEKTVNPPEEADHPADTDHAEVQAEALYADTGTGDAPHHTHTRLVTLHS